MTTRRPADARAATVRFRAATLPRSRPIGLAGDWKAQPRSWPHALHPMCTYLGSLPASAGARPHRALESAGRRGPRPVLRSRHRAPAGGPGTAHRRGHRPQSTRAPADGGRPGPAVAPRRADAPGSCCASRWTETRDDWRAAAREMTAAGGRGDRSSTPRRWPSCCWSGMSSTDEPVDRSCSRPSPGSSMAGARAALTDAMPNTFSMAAGLRRAVAGRPRRRCGTGRPQRDLFAVVERRVTWLLREGRPGDARHRHRR